MTVDPGAIAVAKGATQVALYGGALGVIGAGTCRRVVFPRVGTPLHGADRAAADVAAASAMLLLAAVALRLYVQVIDSYLTLVPTPQMLRMLIFSTRAWGIGLLAQLCLGAALVMLTRAARPGRRGAGALATWAGIVAAATVPLTGHAAAHGGPAGIAAQALHVLALGAWLGALAVLLRTTAPVPVDALAAGVRAFSPVARVAAPTMALAGVAALLSHVGTDGLVGSPYGSVLAGKAVLFAAAASLGYVNWTRRTPLLVDDAGRRRFIATARVELGLAAVALVITAVLTAMGRPGD